MHGVVATTAAVNKQRSMINDKRSYESPHGNDTWMSTSIYVSA